MGTRQPPSVYTFQRIQNIDETLHAMGELCRERELFSGPMSTESGGSGVSSTAVAAKGVLEPYLSNAEDSGMVSW